MLNQKIPARTGNGDEVVRESVGRFIKREEEFVVDSLGIVGVVVIENQRHAHQSPERLSEDIGGNQVTMKNVGALGEKERRKRGEIGGEKFVRRETMDLDARLAETVPINPVAVHRGDLMAKSRTATSGEVENNLLSSPEVEAVDDMENAFHRVGLRALHCCQTYSHQR